MSFTVLCSECKRVRPSEIVGHKEGCHIHRCLQCGAEVDVYFDKEALKARIMGKRKGGHMSNADHIEIYKDDANEYRWRAKAANGEVIAQGEGYTRKDDAIRGIPAEFADTPVVEKP